MRATALRQWRELDPGGPSTVVWARPVDGRAVVLLGAFDPPTNAHLAIADAAGRACDAAVALCATKVVLARGDDRLLSPGDRVALLDAIAGRCGYGLAFANRGTYLDVGRALRASGVDATFVVGADKLEQLADPSFYEDGHRGVEATFAELAFVVVPRDPAPGAGSHLRTLETREVFDSDATAAISASAVRALVRAGGAFEHLVPPEVVPALRGYTSAR